MLSIFAILLLFTDGVSYSVKDYCQFCQELFIQCTAVSQYSLQTATAWSMQLMAAQGTSGKLRKCKKTMQLAFSENMTIYEAICKWTNFSHCPAWQMCKCAPTGRHFSSALMMRNSIILKSQNRKEVDVEVEVVGVGYGEVKGVRIFRTVSQ